MKPFICFRDLITELQVSAQYSILFDEHFARRFEKHWRKTWRHTGRRTVPQISLETPSPLGMTKQGTLILLWPPPYRRRLWVKIHPSLTWPNCVLDTQIISKRAVYIIMLISGRISFFQLVALVFKFICYIQSEREWELIVSSVISRATSKENVMTRLFRQFLFSRNVLVAIS